MSNNNSESESCSDTSSEMNHDEGLGTNMDPTLVNLMGLINAHMNKEQKTKVDWTPPSHSGLSNSDRIIPMNTTREFGSRKAEFESIKKRICSHEKMSNFDMNFICSLSDGEKYELIKLYNNLI